MEDMRQHHQVIRIRFTLRLLLVAVTSCAVALAIIAQTGFEPLFMAACCVMSFWLGVAMLVAGDALTTVRSALVYAAGAMFMSAGFIVALLSVMFGALAVEFVLFYVAMGLFLRD